MSNVIRRTYLYGMSQAPYGDAPFEKKTIPLTEAEIRYMRNQYKILLLLPALFVGLFCITWYYNPPSNVRDSVYAAAMLVGIVAATYFMVTRIQKKEGNKVVIRGVILGKRKQGMGSKSKYYLKLGDEEIKVNESDYNGYEPGDLVSMEIMDDPLLRRPKITLVERASERG